MLQLIAILVKMTFFTYFKLVVFAGVNLTPLKSLKNRHTYTLYTKLLSLQISYALFVVPYKIITECTSV